MTGEASAICPWSKPYLGVIKYTVVKTFAIVNLLRVLVAQLLKNLRRSVATLQICGEWRAENEDATLEMSTQRVWVQGRAPQKRLSALQVCSCQY